MTLEDLTISLARKAIDATGNDALSLAFDAVEPIIRQSVSDAVREVAISAPGVVLEDKRVHGGAVVEDVSGACSGVPFPCCLRHWPGRTVESIRAAHAAKA